MLKLFVIATAILSGLAFNSGNNQAVKPLETEIKNLATTDTEYMESLFAEKQTEYPSIENCTIRLFNKVKYKFYETDSYEYYLYIHYLDLKENCVVEESGIVDGFKGGVYIIKKNKSTDKFTIIYKEENFKNKYQKSNFSLIKNGTNSIMAYFYEEESYNYLFIKFGNLSLSIKYNENDFDFYISEEEAVTGNIEDYYYGYTTEENLEELYPDLLFSNEYENVVLNEYLYCSPWDDYIKFCSTESSSLYVKINFLKMTNIFDDITNAGMTQKTNLTIVCVNLDCKIIYNDDILYSVNVNKIGRLDGFDYSNTNVGPKIKWNTRPYFELSGGNWVMSYDGTESSIDLFTSNIGPGDAQITENKILVEGSNKNYININFVTEKDYEKGPQILGPDKLESKYSEALTQEEIISNYRSYDLTQLEDPQITIKNDSGYFNAVENEKYGTYKLTLSAIDEDDHETERIIEIELIDNSDEYLPKITGPRKVYKANNILLTIEDIKTLYKAEDEDGNTLDVEVKNLTYLDNANKVGSYKVKVTATDSKDRTRELPVTIEVLDGCSDMWYTNPTEIHTTQHSALTIEQIMHEYEWYSGNEIFYYEVLDDTYSEMSDVPGTYNIEVEITNFEKQYVEEITIHVDEAATLVTAAEQNFLYWLGRFFDWLWNDIILFFC